MTSEEEVLAWLRDELEHQRREQSGGSTADYMTPDEVFETFGVRPLEPVSAVEAVAVALFVQAVPLGYVESAALGRVAQIAVAAVRRNLEASDE